MKLSWFGPSLARRIVVAVLLALVLAGVGLTLDSYREFKRDEVSSSLLTRFTRAFTRRLAEVSAPDEAVLLIRNTEALANDMRSDFDYPMENCLWQLYDNRGKLIYATRGQPLTPIPTRLGIRIRTQVKGKLYWTIAVKAGPWKIIFSEPKLNDATAVSWISTSLIHSLLLAFPLILLPVWYGVSRGLRPLRRLKEHLAKRDPDDLSPLGVDMKYPELAQVTVAFDELLAKLRQKVERERAFVQDAAHELRTPMAVISAQAHVLARANNAEDRRAAETALDSAIARASHLTRQLLALASVDHADDRIAAPLNIAALIQQMLAQRANDALARNIELSLDAPEQLMLTIGRPTLESIVQNLLDNALKYGKEGGRIEVRLSEQLARVELEVADDGPGIPPEDRPHVFERFYRGKGHDSPGTGLGLAICREAVLALGGSLSLRDGLGGLGAAFLVRLPRLQHQRQVENPV